MSVIQTKIDGLVNSLNSETELSELDQICLLEIRSIIDLAEINCFDVYKELTYLYVRYTNTTTPYKHISPFIEEDSTNHILYIISSLRAFTAYNLMDFYEQLIYESMSIVTSSIKNKCAVRSSTLTGLIKNFNYALNLEEKLVSLEVSLCEFSEYMSYVKNLFENSKASLEDLEYLFAICIYFSYIERDDNAKWDDSADLIIKVFNKYAHDALRGDSFLNMNGIKFFELFKMNEMMQRKKVRDINLWVLAGYRYRLDSMLRDFADIRESIQREEYSVNYSRKCHDTLVEAKNIHSAYIFFNWNVNYGEINQAKKVISLYIWADYRIKSLKEI